MASERLSYSRIVHILSVCKPRRYVLNVLVGGRDGQEVGLRVARLMKVAWPRASTARTRSQSSWPGAAATTRKCNPCQRERDLH